MVYLEGNKRRWPGAQRFYCILLRVSFGPAFAHQNSVPAFALSVVCAPLTRKHGTSEHHDRREVLPKRQGSGARPLGRFLFEGGAWGLAFACQIFGPTLTIFSQCAPLTRKHGISEHHDLYELLPKRRGSGAQPLGRFLFEGGVGPSVCAPDTRVHINLLS